MYMFLGDLHPPCHYVHRQTSPQQNIINSIDDGATDSSRRRLAKFYLRLLY